MVKVTLALTETVDGVTWHYYVTNGCASLGRPHPNEQSSLKELPLPAHEGTLPTIVVIPDTLGGHSVTNIDDVAFQFKKECGVELVIVPESVKTLSACAFVGEYVGLRMDMETRGEYCWNMASADCDVKFLFKGDCPQRVGPYSYCGKYFYVTVANVNYYMRHHLDSTGAYGQFYGSACYVAEGTDGWNTDTWWKFNSLYHETRAQYGAAKIDFMPDDERIPQSGEIVLSCPNDFAQIYYTTDGSEPTTNQTDKCFLYIAPIECNSKMTIRALAYVDEYPYTPTYSKFFRVGDVAKPVVEPSATTYANTSQTVSISCETEGATIYYTTDGSDPRENGLEYKKPFEVYKSCTVRAIAVKDDWKDSAEATATFTRNESLSEAANMYGYLMENDDAHPWTVATDVSHDGVSSARSGIIGNNETTCLQTSVKKVGTVSFWWRAACEEADEEYYDYGTFSVDGSVVARIAGHDGEWYYVSHEITGGGKHTLKWEYSKDGVTSYAPDCIWLDRVQWIPADGSGYTLTTPEPVPYSWLTKYGLGLESDFESAANALSGKMQGGKETKVWEEFVAGTDPTNETSVLTAMIEMQDGVPIITWEPNLNTNGEVRLYKVYGKETLPSSEDWAYPTNSLHRFFKVTVEMP